MHILTTVSTQQPFYHPILWSRLNNRRNIYGRVSGIITSKATCSTFIGGIGVQRQDNAWALATCSGEKSMSVDGTSQWTCGWWSRRVAYHHYYSLWFV